MSKTFKESVQFTWSDFKEWFKRRWFSRHFKSILIITWLFLPYVIGFSLIPFGFDDILSPKTIEAFFIMIGYLGTVIMVFIIWLSFWHNIFKYMGIVK